VGISARGGLEPALRVLFSALFHSIAQGNWHQRGKQWKVVEAKLLQAAASLRTFFVLVISAGALKSVVPFLRCFVLGKTAQQLLNVNTAPTQSISRPSLASYPARRGTANRGIGARSQSQRGAWDTRARHEDSDTLSPNRPRASFQSCCFPWSPWLTKH
jgi:hypothetical protein